MIHLIAASGRSGRALAQALRAQNRPYVPVTRTVTFPADGPKPRIADLTDAAALKAALQDARIVVSCAHARHAPAILAAAPNAEKFVFLGSTRRFTQWPDDHANGVLTGEAAFLQSSRRGVMLHPTMIYGAEGEDNVQRLASLLARLPVVPLPGGGRSLVQPIHQSDLTRCLLAAVDHPWTGTETLTIAGPTPLPYAEFVQVIAAAMGRPPVRIIPLPAWLLIAATPLTWLPGLPTVRAAEIRRLLEDKAFPIGPMTGTLGVTPIPLAEGLRLTFGK